MLSRDPIDERALETGTMALPNAEHEHVLQAGSARARLAKLYAEALLVTAPPSSLDSIGKELDSFVSGVLDKDPQVEAFLASPAIGKKVKLAVLDKALPGHASDLMRGLFATLARNSRLDLVRGIAATYRNLLDVREGRVRVKVTTAAELSDAQRGTLSTTLSNMLKKTPVLDVRVEPDILGGMVVQVGDRVIDTSVRTRLHTLRTLLLDKGISHGN
jgi:F-type H+-transporting ATPase subunit delta